MQVAEAVHRYGKSLGVRVLPIYGGQSMQQQLRALKRSLDVIVATPGRVLDHIRRESVDLSHVRTVVLDEADEMLDMGFAEDLEAILSALPKERQTALFSATIAPRIAQIAKSHLTNPIRITIARDTAAADAKAKVREVAYVVNRQHKPEALGRVLDMENPTSAIIFCRMRTEVDELTEVLSARGYEVESLHGGHNQEQRDRVMRRFREGTTQLLTATDVAARGLDIGHLSHVVNYDVPWTAEAYVHRVGRTGRAGREGVAITILEPREQRLLRNIEQQAKRKISIEKVPTIVDVRARRMEQTGSAVREVLEAGDYENYSVLVDALAGDYELRDIAAAAIKLAQGEEDVGAEIDLAPPVRAERPPRDKDEQGGRRDKRPPRTDRLPKRGNSAKDASFVRIYIPIGRMSKIRPGDLVGAIANEAGVDSSLIGSIDITDKFSLVEVPDAQADDIIGALNQTTIRGKRVKARRERF
jgi:ATP-dependent RNA helicase DeaD